MIINNYSIGTKMIGSFVRILTLGVCSVVLIFLNSCEDFLEVDLNKSKISRDNVFADDITATSAITGMYVNLLSPTGFASGDKNSVTILGGLCSDELTDVADSGDSKQFEINEIDVRNPLIKNAWDNLYWTLFQVNSIIEGLEKSPGVTEATKRQLLGESYFIRAFTHFYLVNLFGPIPLVTETAYEKNTNIARSSETDIYNSIEQDLQSAKELLNPSYPTAERIRPNRATATALLSRVYLYRGKWANAISEANGVIDDENYELLADLNTVFLANSRESIWQLKPNEAGKNTNEGALFILFFGSPNFFNPFTLHESLYEGFVPGDLRFTNWVTQSSDGATTYYSPSKYKVSYTSGPLIEYSMVFRLAEQYLIRAEAKAMNDDLEGAIDDLDIIRGRAGISLIRDTNPAISRSELLLAIEQERKVELFVEWGHRWLDLKRTNRANDVLAPLKARWQSTDVLFPLPQSEFERNTMLGDQNLGY